MFEFDDDERGREGDRGYRNAEEAERPRIVERSAWLTVIFATLMASMAFRALGANGWEHTSLVFIGIPAIIAVTIIMMPQPRSVTGVILKSITLALAVSAIVFGEGFVCILFAAPLFYLVGIIIGIAADWRRRAHDGGHHINGTVMVALLIIGPSSLEGVIPGFEFQRDATVTRTRVVEGSADDVEAALARVPRFDRELPTFFKLGFPTPGVTGGEGLTVGAERRIEFVHGGHHPGSLVLRVASRTPRSITFRPAHDDSYITHWLSWRDIDVEWREVAPGRTEVSWTLRYRRRLDPAWYFAPLERYATGLAASYLIDTVATPSRHSAGYTIDTRAVDARPATRLLPHSHVLPGSTRPNLNPSPWDQGEGQGRGFEPLAASGTP